ncbi:MAG: glycosyltransferase family 92 protein [Verrucomicrobia bacterium]|nr:glycosyltransferase family 92 protein [Verrucomicrobiota bacterium]
MKRILFILAACLPIFILLWASPPPKYYLSAGAIFRNEARFLKEWIEYHRMIGVEHFYLYNNLSEDDYHAVLDPYIKEGVVELFEWPHQAKKHKHWNKIQCGAYWDLVQKKKHETFWLAIIDTDEFIVPTETHDLRTFLKGYEKYGGLGINWQHYGNTGLTELKENQTLIGSLTKKAPTDYYRNKFVKSIVQPKLVEKITQPHYCRYKKPYYHVTENKVPFPRKSLSETVSVEKIRINHYIYRDEKFFYTEKRRRVADWFPTAAPLEMNPEYVALEDKVIFPFIPELEGRLKK